jgi:hypothetical protein
MITDIHLYSILVESTNSNKIYDYLEQQWDAMIEEEVENTITG